MANKAMGKLRHIRVEPADNGALITASHEPSKVQRGPVMYDSNESRSVHPTAESAGAHVTKLLKAHGIGKVGAVKTRGSVGAKTEAY
jgi:hypothetical protein